VVVEGLKPDHTLGTVVVAGHICLDIIPELPPDERPFTFLPGTLAEIGAASVATGGCVPNTGIALHRLGVPTRLLGKVGDDPFGRVVARVLADIDPALAAGLLVDRHANTSYSLVLSPPGRDRMVLHYPGANDTYDAEDITDAALAGATIFHFGYPPLMRRMYEDDGSSLVNIFQRAKSAGLTTSLDMAYPDPLTPAGRADWRAILSNVLPWVDVFVPSLEEVLVMLDAEDGADLARGSTALATIPAARVSRLGGQLIGLGAAIVGIKVGDRGFYLRTSSPERLAAAGPEIGSELRDWANLELWTAVFETHAVGTIGAGDATAAGFLYGLLARMTPEDAVTAACAVGASSVEAADATSGITSWDQTQRRISVGWRRRPLTLGPDWVPAPEEGLWVGPNDRRL
jgi:sugar/nucleoside kinase (ribokinase family)